MLTTLAHPTLHMNGHIWTLFQAMANRAIEIPENIYLRTRPYCNCREQGFVVSVSTYSGESRRIHYAFYEHRNSDSICVVKWSGHTNITGAITPDDIPEETMKDKWDVTKYWPHMDIWGPIEYLENEIKGFE